MSGKCHTEGSLRHEGLLPPTSAVRHQHAVKRNNTQISEGGRLVLIVHGTAYDKCCTAIIATPYNKVMSIETRGPAWGKRERAGERELNPLPCVRSTTDFRLS